MADNQPLLSICIPTYNRADILNDTLISLTQDPDFSDKVEVVISDNCSTDNTETIVNEFIKRFDNIIYSKNLENVKDANFFKVLSLGKGKYLKLINDTIKFNNGMLKFILDKIKEDDSCQNQLFFYQNTYWNCDTQLWCENVNDFVYNASFLSTWIANFGIWKDKLTELKDVDRSVSLMLVQVDWSLQLSSSQKVLIYYRDFFEVTSLKKKGGYNIFKVFIENYLMLLSNYIGTKQLQKKVFRNEKRRLYNFFVLPWLYKLVLKGNKQYFFDTQKMFPIILKYFWYCPYIYLSPITLIIKKIRKVLHNL